MTDFKQANSLAIEALKLWELKNFADAADRYARAIELAPSYPDWHGAYAGVLYQMGRHEDATRQYEIALALELARAKMETDPMVKVARYFLGDHLRKTGHPGRALDVLGPAAIAFPNDWLISSAVAHALFLLGRTREAKAMAERAIADTFSESKKAELTENLGEVLRSSTE